MCFLTSRVCTLYAVPQTQPGRSLQVRSFRGEKQAHEEEEETQPKNYEHNQFFFFFFFLSYFVRSGSESGTGRKCAAHKKCGTHVIVVKMMYAENILRRKRRTHIKNVNRNCILLSITWVNSNNGSRDSGKKRTTQTYLMHADRSSCFPPKMTVCVCAMSMCNIAKYVKSHGNRMAKRCASLVRLKRGNSANERTTG